MQDGKLGSVRLVITSYGQQILEGTHLEKKKLQTNYAKKPCSVTRELHQAKMTVHHLTQRIEEKNSRTRAQIQEKLKMAKRREGEWNQIEKVMKELESVKLELSKLKLEKDSISEEKRRAEKEADSSMSKALSYSSSLEAFTNEIDEINEEHVLVELARIEASKDCREIEAQRRENTEKYSIILEEMHKKKMSMIQEVEDAKDLERKLAIKKTDISMLESKLKQFESNFHEHGELESLTRELEATMKETTSVEGERFESMASIDVFQNELTRILEEADAFKEKEGKADRSIQSLNLKLLRANSKLEASSGGADNAKSTVSNLSLALEQIKSEEEKAKKEQSMICKETALIKAEVQKTETEKESAEGRLEAALKNLEAAKSSEAIALENLKAAIQKTMRNRGLSAQCSGRSITISKFEYDYMKGSAGEAIEIADKKVAAAWAWVEALKASETENVIKTDLAKRESRERSVEREGDGSMIGRRAKVGKSASATVRRGSRSASFTVRRRK